jgi:hypothetical protein
MKSPRRRPKPPTKTKKSSPLHLEFALLFLGHKRAVVVVVVADL